MKKHVFFYSLVSLAFLTSCGNSDTKKDNNETKETEVVDETSPTDYPETYEESGLKLYPATPSTQFEGAKLTFKTRPSAPFTDNKVAFNFAVENYELGAQTPDAKEKGLANSAKGQHIHLIVDNGPYSAHYEAGFEKSFEPGHHVAIAFLSRSYHESVKEADAHQVFQFTIGDNGAKDIDLSQPMLFYSRPKGTYTGAAATEKILLDFFLKNTDISVGGNTIQITINNDYKFMLDTWQPYYIEGLPWGENTINLQLLDANGKLVDTPMNNITRTFTLTEEAKE